MKGHNQNSA